MVRGSADLIRGSADMEVYEHRAALTQADHQNNRLGLLQWQEHMQSPVRGMPQPVQPLTPQRVCSLRSTPMLQRDAMYCPQ